MVGHKRAFFRRHLGGANIESAINLARIGRDNLAIKTPRQGYAQPAFARRRWPKYNNQVL
jgi:hypothetical protein